MRPALHPALARLRRDPATVQVGLDPGPSVILGGLDPVVADVLVGLDSECAVTDLRRTVSRRGADPAALDSALDALDRAGLLVLGPPATTPESVAESLVVGPAAARRARDARARAWVEVRGADRVGAAVASLLTAAGTGRVTVVDPCPTRPDEPAPGALGADDVGLPRGPAAEHVAHRAGPGHRGRVSHERRRPDLVVLTPGASLLRASAAALLREGVPHLVVRVGATAGTVGPLVRPGSTSCLRCHDLRQADRDAGWPDLVEQTDRHTSATPTPVPLAWALAALAAQHVATEVGGGDPATVDATVDVALPDLMGRRRRWRQHPACGCAWPH